MIASPHLQSHLSGQPGWRLSLLVSRRSSPCLRTSRVRPSNNSFRPNLLRYGFGLAGKACHAKASTQVGSTQVLGVMIRALLLSFVFFASGATASLATLFLPVEVATQEAAKRVPMGLPVPFVWQDMTRYDPPSWPKSYRFYSPQEHPTSVHLLWFSFSVAFFATVFAGAALVVRSSLRRWRSGN